MNIRAGVFYFCRYMSYFLYNFFLRLYWFSILVASPFNTKANLFIKGRKNIWQNLRASLQEETAPIIWVHCASLGEFEQGRPLIESLKQGFPAYKILLTFFSPSGYEVRKDYALADYIFYLPTDSRSNAHKFIEIVKPKMAILVKYEFWFFYIRALKKNGIPVLSVSSIFRPSQIYFKRYGGFYRRILYRITHFFVQDPKSLSLLKKIKIDRAMVSGDTRFDRVWEICKSRKEIPEVSAFKNDHQLMIIGSAWPEDMELLIPFINENNIKFIIAPHEISPKFIQDMESNLNKPSIRYSQLIDNVNVPEVDVLIIDNIGMLSSLYGYADFAYVGGAFGNGLHNILEPATFGIPVFFGNKNYKKFNEAVDLTKLGGAATVDSYDSLIKEYRLFSDRNTYDIASHINKTYIAENRGATGKVISYCKKLLKP